MHFKECLACFGVLTQSWLYSQVKLTMKLSINFLLAFQRIFVAFYSPRCFVAAIDYKVLLQTVLLNIVIKKQF